MPSILITGMAYIFLASGIFGLVTSTVFAVLVVAGMRRHLRNRPGSRVSGFTPPLSLLKPLRGDEPCLEASLATFFEQDYPAYEILFCARSLEDEGLRVAHRVAARYPHIPVRFLSTNGYQPYINAKVASLEIMAAEAAHSILVISDSDVRVTPGYLREVARPFADAKTGAMTCLYKGVAAEGGLWARLEAVGMSVEMSAGVLVANMLEGMQFVLGPTMAVRKECVTAMGGMAVLGDYCADDYVLGNRVFLQGRTVALSHHVIDHLVINASFVDSMRHQIRWMQSTRFSRPKGHFGTSLTFSMPFGLLAFAAAVGLGHAWLASALLTWAIATRWVIAWAAGRRVVQDRSLVNLFVLYPIRDLMGFGFWVASYLSSTIVWRGKLYELLAGGRMRAAEDAQGR
jgi:ceramide glucosyltransferase